MLCEEIIESDSDVLEKLKAIYLEMRNIARGVYWNERGFWYNADRLVDIPVSICLHDLRRDIKKIDAGKLRDNDLNNLVIRYDNILFEFSKRAYEGIEIK